MESNHEVESTQFQVENVLSNVQAEDSIGEEPQHPTIIDSEAELEDKVVSEDSKLQAEKRSELSEHENIYERKNLLQIPEEDLDMASNFLNGEGLMENDILEFL